LFAFQSKKKKQKQLPLSMDNSDEIKDFISDFFNSLPRPIVVLNNDAVSGAIYECFETAERKLAMQKSAQQTGLPLRFLPRIGSNITARVPEVKRTGRDRLSDIWKWIKVLCDNAQPDPYRLSKDQINFIWVMIRATLPCIFIDDFDTEGIKYMNERGWNGQKPFVLMLAWRQVGKTTSIVIFIAAFFLAVEYAKQNVFSTCQRISEMILARIMSLLNSVPDLFETYKVEPSVKRIKLIGHSDPADERIITAYPGNKDTVRGFDGRGIHYVDECAYVKPLFMNGTLIPACSDPKSALIMTTTIQGKDNHTSVMSQLKDPNGEPVVNLIHVVGVCAKCAAAGKASTCKHKATDVPEFKDEERMEVIKKLIGNDNKTMAQEMGGQIVDSDNCSFPGTHIDVFLEFPLMKLQNTDCPDVLFVTIDPNGGGSSHLAMVTLFESKSIGKYVVRIVYYHFGVLYKSK
jgi:hypothetical protein